MFMIAVGGGRENIKIYVLSPKLTYSMYVGDGALWLEKKSPLIGRRALHVRGEWEQIGMETRLTMNFPPSSTVDYRGR